MQILTKVKIMDATRMKTKIIDGSTIKDSACTVFYSSWTIAHNDHGFTFDQKGLQ